MEQTLKTLAQRYSAGKALRRKSPREGHAKLPAANGRDPVAILAADDAARVEKLVPERYARMLENPFAFLRGAASLMASDLQSAATSGLPVQACGDCHLMNFGAFLTPENNILFDVNDFDETLGGVDFTVDLKRLCASVAVAATTNNKAISAKAVRRMAQACAEAYRLRMIGLSGLSPLEVWSARVEPERELGAFRATALRKKLAQVFAQVRAGANMPDEDSPHLAAGRKLAIADKPPTIFHFDPQALAQDTIDAEAVLAAYRAALAPELAELLRRYELVDIAFKAVGVGSVGTFCAVALLSDPDGHHFFLQLKEARRSVLERLHSTLAWSGHQGQRVVQGQNILQAASDMFLGWTQDAASGRQFYVRSLKNRRLGDIGEMAEQGDLADYASLCGRTLARAHARSGDVAAIAGYMGKSPVFDKAVAAFAADYVARNAADHAALVKARGVAKAPPAPAQKAAKSSASATPSLA